MFTHLRDLNDSFLHCSFDGRDIRLSSYSPSIGSHDVKDDETDATIFGDVDKEAASLGNGSGCTDDDAIQLTPRPEGEKSRNFYERRNSATWPHDVSTKDVTSATVFLRLKSGSFKDIAQVLFGPVSIRENATTATDGLFKYYGRKTYLLSFKTCLIGL